MPEQDGSKAGDNVESLWIKTSPVRPNNQPGDVVDPSAPSSGLLTSPTLAPRMSYSRNELGPARPPCAYTRI